MPQGRKSSLERQVTATQKHKVTQRLCIY